ncbi:MAG: DNA mismatch repair protein MutS [Candidatus Shikimatogenerans bostrichidophilus]|nr:MAG: DNA mismatch repair protein MutS [Candidatus Shikimatogenerans bostrichidophilus]
MYKETPLIKQYYNLKSKNPDYILFFQVGDFYEIFGYDAILCSKLLDITLTKRNKKNNNSIYLVGFPCISLEIYVKKLVKYGFKVAICDQDKKKKNNDDIINRKITNIVTPGLSIYDNISNKKNFQKFITSIYLNKKNSYLGISFIDFSTGEFFTTEGKINYIKHIINCYNPKEFFIQKSKKQFFYKYLYNNNIKLNISLLNDNLFNYKLLHDKLLEHFKVYSLNCFGIENMKFSVISSGILIYYISKYYNLKLNHINNIKIIEKNKYVWIDDSTIKNLEIIKSINKNGKSLFDILDNTYTSMGFRLLNNWIMFPLKDKLSIKYRQNIINYFLKKNNKNNNMQLSISYNLKKIFDIEKLLSKISNKKIFPNQLYKLLLSLKRINNIFNIIKINNNNKIFNFKKKYIYKLKKIYNKIYKTIIKNPINNFNKEFFIKKKISKKLDNYKKIFYKKEKQINIYYKYISNKINIKYLKLKFNDIIGYYIDIKNKDKKKIPKDWIIKQKLSSYIRYTNNVINKYEYKVYYLKKKIFLYEKIIFYEIIDYLNKNIFFLKKITFFIAKIDVLFSFFLCAKENNYIKPLIKKNNKNNITIIKGRHPVIEKNMFLTNNYIPNDIYLDNYNNQILIITGPNMSGKSAILRQTALIILMAQIGSFVPAEYLEFNIIDKIFTRIGASDNISIGESTFMVEMNETSNILNNFTKNSLIIMDEIGRGTSTYDGISLSYSIIKYINNSKLKPKLLFATHYHELKDLLYKYNYIKFYYLSIKKINNNFIFLRKLKEGQSNNSYGIYIAQMAGIPKKIIKNSKNIFLFLKKKNKKNYFLKKILFLFYLIKKKIKFLIK